MIFRSSACDCRREHPRLPKATTINRLGGRAPGPRALVGTRDNNKVSVGALYPYLPSAGVLVEQEATARNQALAGSSSALLRVDGASGSSHRRVQCHGGAMTAFSTFSSILSPPWNRWHAWCCLRGWS